MLHIPNWLEALYGINHQLASVSHKYLKENSKRQYTPSDGVRGIIIKECCDYLMSDAGVKKTLEIDVKSGVFKVYVDSEEDSSEISIDKIHFSHNDDNDGSVFVASFNEVRQLEREINKPL